MEDKILLAKNQKRVIDPCSADMKGIKPKAIRVFKNRHSYQTQVPIKQIVEIQGLPIRRTELELPRTEGWLQAIPQEGVETPQNKKGGREDTPLSTIKKD